MGLANRPRLEDYREKYAKHFKMERRDGILQVQMHTDGGPLNFQSPRSQRLAAALDGYRK
jgi:hypothetical protein